MGVSRVKESMERMAEAQSYYVITARLYSSGHEEESYEVSIAPCPSLLLLSCLLPPIRLSWSMMRLDGSRREAT